MAKAVTKSVKQNVVCGVSLTGQELLEQIGTIEVTLDDVPEGEDDYYYADRSYTDYTFKVKVDGKEVAPSKIEFIITEKTKKGE